MNAQQIILAARTAHEVNRAYCTGLGDTSQIPWDDAPQWQRDSCIDGVRFLVDNPDVTPDQLHENWLSHKLDDGWVCGSVKDADKKEHPCCVPYHELPAEQKTKDVLYQATVRGILEVQ